MLCRSTDRRVVCRAADLSVIPDGNTVSGYARSAMARAVVEGMFQGDAEDYLNATANVTRAEFASMLRRFMEG